MSQKHEAVILKHQLEAKKFLVVRNGGGHWEVQDPRTGARITSFGNTPGGGRWKLNVLGQIRRWQRRHPEADYLQPV